MYYPRRSIVFLVLLGVALSTLMACAAPAAPTAVPTTAPTGQQQPTAAPAATQASQPATGGKRTLVVAGWGGLWEESFLKAVARPFEASHPGVEIVHMISGGTTEMLAKLRAEKNNPTIDIIGIGAGFERVMSDEGLVRELDQTKVPNLKDVFPAGNYKNKMVANTFNGLGLAYHKDRVPQPPTSWFDLWDPKFGGVAIADITNTGGYTLFDAVNQLQGGTPENTEPGWKKYEELIKTQKPTLVKNISDEAINTIVQRGGSMAVAGNSRVVAFMKEGYPVGFVFPKEGALVWGTYMGVVANGKNEDLAMELINFWLDPKVNGEFATLTNYGPGNTKAMLPADYKYKEYLMFGDTLTKARKSDWDYLMKNLPGWTERWTTKILPLYK